MNPAYPSNLTPEQFELLSSLIPPAKPGGRPRSVEIWDMLNAIYVLCEGCRWRSLPDDFRNWRIDGTWIQSHSHLREWVRVDEERSASPSEAVIDSQSVKTAAMVSEKLGSMPEN